MKMKNVLMILITLAVVFTMVGVVSATTGFGQNGDETGSMIVQHSVDNSYIITIPPEVVVGVGEPSDNQTVDATSVLIEPNHCLKVNLTSGNHWDGGIYNLTNGAGSVIPYYINKTGSASTSGSTPVNNDDTILTVAAGHPHPVLSKTSAGTASIGDYVNLTFETTTNFIAYATMSGLHQDSLTFMAWISPTNS